MNLTQLVAEYGQHHGLPHLALPGQGPALLSAEQICSVLIEADDEDLLLYAVVPAPFAPPQLLMACLQAADVRRQPAQGWPVKVGARGQGADLVLVLLLRLSQEQLGLQAMEEALASLMTFVQTHACVDATR